MRRSLLMLSATALAAAAAQPAVAVPPLVVVGSGTILPGLSPTPPYPPQSFAFTGTGTDPLLATHPCWFSGTGTVTGPNTTAGTMSGACGPYTYSSCTFVLTVTSWTFTCGASTGAFSVRPHNVNPTTSFDASGTIS